MFTLLNYRINMLHPCSPLANLCKSHHPCWPMVDDYGSWQERNNGTYQKTQRLPVAKKKNLCGCLCPTPQSIITWQTNSSSSVVSPLHEGKSSCFKQFKASSAAIPDEYACWPRLVVGMSVPISSQQWKKKIPKYHPNLYSIIDAPCYSSGERT